mgnify:CR=1 FL=1
MKLKKKTFKTLYHFLMVRPFWLAIMWAQVAVSFRFSLRSIDACDDNCKYAKLPHRYYSMGILKSRTLKTDCIWWRPFVLRVFSLAIRGSIANLLAQPRVCPSLRPSVNIYVNVLCRFFVKVFDCYGFLSYQV